MRRTSATLAAALALAAIAQPAGALTLTATGLIIGFRTAFDQPVVTADFAVGEPAVLSLSVSDLGVPLTVVEGDPGDTSTSTAALFGAAIGDTGVPAVGPALETEFAGTPLSVNTSVGKATLTLGARAFGLARGGFGVEAVENDVPAVFDVDNLAVTSLTDFVETPGGQAAVRSLPGGSLAASVDGGPLRSLAPVSAQTAFYLPDGDLAAGELTLDTLARFADVAPFDFDPGLALGEEAAGFTVSGLGVGLVDFAPESGILLDLETGDTNLASAAVVFTGLEVADAATDLILPPGGGIEITLGVGTAGDDGFVDERPPVSAGGGVASLDIITPVDPGERQTLPNTLRFTLAPSPVFVGDLIAQGYGPGDEVTLDVTGTVDTGDPEIGEIDLAILAAVLFDDFVSGSVEVVSDPGSVGYAAFFELDGRTVGLTAAELADLEITVGPPPPLGSELNPVLPDETGGEGFDFSNVFVEDSLEFTFIDPEVAVGYDYVAEAGVLIDGVLTPFIGDGLYELWLPGEEAGVFEPTGVTLEANVPYLFETPVSAFRILGIEPEAMLDPDDPLAFNTGLSFVAPGFVDVRQIPLTAEIDDGSGGGDGGGGTVIPLPAGALLLGPAVAALAALRRRRRA